MSPTGKARSIIAAVGLLAVSCSVGLSQVIDVFGRIGGGVSGGQTGPQRVSFKTTAGYSFTNVTVLSADEKTITIQDGSKEKVIPRLFLKPADSKAIHNAQRLSAEAPAMSFTIFASVNDRKAGGFISRRWRVGDGPHMNFNPIFVKGADASSKADGELWQGSVTKDGLYTNETEILRIYTVVPEHQADKRR